MFLLLLLLLLLPQGANVVEEVVVCEHDALGQTGGAR
jgi:hypothetical protein